MGWAEEIAKLLPEVYGDLAKPAVRQVGEALETATKAARLVTAPIEALAAVQDRVQRYFKRLADKVPEDRMIEAHPQIAGPVLDGLRYVPEDSVITELFLNLLARAIDKERVGEAHPAFPQIISQLTPDEAYIIYELHKKTYVYRQHAVYHRDTNTFSSNTVTFNEFPTERLVYPDNFGVYMNHLHSLSLAGIWQDGNQEPIMEGDPPVQTGVNIKSISQLTTFGHMFANACAPKEIEGWMFTRGQNS